MRSLHLLATAAALAFIGVTVVDCHKKAHAAEHHLSFTFEPYYKFGRTSAQIIHIPEPTSEADREDLRQRTLKWVGFCEPIEVVDPLGVTRLQYAHEGCEFGRDH